MTTLAPTAAVGTTIRDRATDLRHNWRQHIPLALLLIGTAVFYLWDITRNEMGNSFYAGAAWAGSENWKALLFGSVDPSNFITVDKPPVSQWVMGLSGQIFGFSSASMLIPEAIMGVLSVWLLYSAVHRLTNNRGASLLAGLALALTPVAALMFRFNNPDAVMVLLMTAAAYCTVRATLAGSAKWLALAGAAMGFAFLAKMLEGLMSLPALALVYLIAAPVVVWHKRILHLLYAGLAMIAASGWYVVLTLLWPKDSRPYLAGSTDNNFMNLVLGYNGLDRIQGRSGGHGGFNPGRLPENITINGHTYSHDQITHAFHGGGMGGASAGLFRLFKGEFAVEISWLIPAAIVAFVAVIVLRWGMPRTDAIRAGGILFFCWMLVDGIVLSYMQGMIHPYYTLAIAPAIAGTVGVGVAAAWAERGRLIGRGFLAAMVVAAGIWGFVVADRAPQWNGWLSWVVLALTIIAAAAIIGSLALPARLTRVVGLGVIAAALIAALAAPAVYAANAVGTKQTGGNPSANPVSRAGGFMGGGTNHHGGGGFGFGGATQADPQLSALLKSANGYRWPAATSRSSSAAGYELAYRVPVMAIGGFMDDPAPSLAQFQQYVKDHDVRYYLQPNMSVTAGTQAGPSTGAPTTGGTTHHRERPGGADQQQSGQPQSGQQPGGFGFGRGSNGVTAQIQQWVDANFHSQTIGGVTVYDLQAPLH
ncbi:ArnT family glycosyltransferase [Jongsikchunia kroppenstedtii]|uniref:ArnT family glycosyltransferase n=1 Tax=Jongsikchunia kroppenstedtii TaxID=1121721 RepID=UPI000367DB39|nr:glycosyltransferase family 39 protein [Jongsikchunia kroppenstedtii]